jgi:hypothetical protein
MGGARLADEIDLSSALPFEFEVEIRNRADLLRQLENSRGSIQLGLTDSEDEVIDFNYVFGSVAHGLPEGTRYRGTHPIRTTAVDLVIANEIFDRIGIYIADALQASVQQVVAAGEPRADNKFIVRGGVLVARPEYAGSVFDLSNSVFRPTTTKIVFNVTDVTLTSPTKVRSYVAAVLVNINLLVAPAAPVAATASQTTAIVQTLSGVAAAVSGVATAAIAVAQFNYTTKVQERTVRESALNDKVKYYQDQINKHHLKAIQFELSLVGGYQGPLDGIIGPDCRRAIARVASLHDLPPNIDYKDPIFLRALASDALEYKPPPLKIGH